MPIPLERIIDNDLHWQVGKVDVAADPARSQLEAHDERVKEMRRRGVGAPLGARTR